MGPWPPTSKLFWRAPVSRHGFSLEILESAVLADMDSALIELERVRQLGVSLALDDFGTGYSSLSYLKQMPVNTLKIDRMFVRNVVSDPDDAAIVAATISNGAQHRLARGR